MGLFVHGERRGERRLDAVAPGRAATFGNGGAPCQLGYMDPETGISFAFLTNGYPMSGYDYSRLGVNRIINIANLGNDLVS